MPPSAPVVAARAAAAAAATGRPVPGVPRRPGPVSSSGAAVGPSPLPVLRRAAALLAEAASAEPATRFALARLSALTTAWAACCGPLAEDTRAHAAGPWALLVLCRPELSGWAAVFVPAETRWAAVSRGGRVARAPAEDLLARARAFHAVVARAVATDGRRDLPGAPGTGRVGPSVTACPR